MTMAKMAERTWERQIVEMKSLLSLQKWLRRVEVEESRGPYWIFLEVISQISMPDNILALAKFYRPVHIPWDALWNEHNLAEQRLVIDHPVNYSSRWELENNFYPISFDQLSWRCPWQTDFRYHSNDTVLETVVTIKCQKIHLLFSRFSHYQFPSTSCL